MAVAIFVTVTAPRNLVRVLFTRLELHSFYRDPEESLRTGVPLSFMPFHRRLLLSLVALCAVIARAEDAATERPADPCLAEDYAEANCMRS